MISEKEKIVYWHISKSERYEFTDKSRCLIHFRMMNGRDPKPHEIAVKKIMVEENVK